MLYGIKVVNEKTKKDTILDLKPMSHREACTMLSKFTDYKDTRKILIEVATNV